MFNMNDIPWPSIHHVGGPPRTCGTVARDPRFSGRGATQLHPWRVLEPRNIAASAPLRTVSGDTIEGFAFEALLGQIGVGRSGIALENTWIT